MSDWKKITPADLEMLPVGHRQKIPEDYLDANNHMNVMWYAGWPAAGHSPPLPV
ncbi:MAG TPA: hypothetical protein VG055_06585 [Planctomycetaceae bacterium]|jgi:hypothetical protein|nr:hypothetical protein [Planctomycetaceae bacterium]